MVDETQLRFFAQAILRDTLEDLGEPRTVEDTLQRIENVTKLLALLVQQAREIQQDKD